MFVNTGPERKNNFVISLIGYRAPRSYYLLPDGVHEPRTASGGACVYSPS